MPSADQLIANDPYATLLGVEVVSQSSDALVLSMEVSDDMANFLGGAHGGAIFSLADVALSVISNEHQTAVAINANVSYVSGCVPGTVLTATARPVKNGRSVATYQVDVTDQDEKSIALFVATVYKPSTNPAQ